MPKVSNIDKPSHLRIKKIIEILDTPKLPVNTAHQALTTETPPTAELNRIKNVIQIQDPGSISPNELLVICQTPISKSNVSTSKIPRSARKNFLQNDKVETSSNRKGNDQTNELGFISKKASQQNPNSKFNRSRKYWNQSQIKG